jgi:hypothetical protein
MKETNRRGDNTCDHSTRSLAAAIHSRTSSLVAFLMILPVLLLSITSSAMAGPLPAAANAECSLTQATLDATRATATRSEDGYGSPAFRGMAWTHLCSMDDSASLGSSSCCWTRATGSLHLRGGGRVKGGGGGGGGGGGISRGMVKGGGSVSGFGQEVMERMVLTDRSPPLLPLLGILRLRGGASASSLSSVSAPAAVSAAGGVDCGEDHDVVDDSDGLFPPRLFTEMPVAERMRSLWAFKDAAKKIGKRGDEARVTTAANEWLNDPSVLVRHEVCYVVGQTCGDEAVGFLAKVLANSTEVSDPRKVLQPLRVSANSRKTRDRSHQ